MESIRKVAAVILTVLVLFFTVLCLLALWDLIEIDIKQLFNRTLFSLLIIFIASVIILFINSVVYRSKDNNYPKPPQMPNY
jgi:heme/copper-type cytochrome/quinol oxidase subunit 2